MRRCRSARASASANVRMRAASCASCLPQGGDSAGKRACSQQAAYGRGVAASDGQLQRQAALPVGRRRRRWRVRDQHLHDGCAALLGGDVQRERALLVYHAGRLWSSLQQQGHSGFVAC